MSSDKSPIPLLCFLSMAGCAGGPPPRVALNGSSPIFDAPEVETSLCEIPIQRETTRCPAVAEKRVWISEDERHVTCRLSVCGEDRVWRRSNGRWLDATLQLR